MRSNTMRHVYTFWYKILLHVCCNSSLASFSFVPPAGKFWKLNCSLSLRKKRGLKISTHLNFKTSIWKAHIKARCTYPSRTVPKVWQMPEYICIFQTVTEIPFIKYLFFCYFFFSSAIRQCTGTLWCEFWEC